MTGRKTWVSFDVLDAADVNSYLADQAVMRFADATARDTAIPSPVDGMVVWLDTPGALQVYDSAWTALELGGAASMPQTRGTALTVDTVGGTFLDMAQDTWTQITAGLASDVVVYDVRIVEPSTSTVFEIGTGAASSEVTRAGLLGVTSQNRVPYGIYVPAGTRIAFRQTSVANEATTTIELFYTEVDGGSEAEAGVITTTGSGWQELGSAPPVAGGVYIVGGLSSSSTGSWQLGTGAAAAETAVSGDIEQIDSDRVHWHPPVWWAPSTRMSVQRSSSGTVNVLWREHIA